MQLSRSSAAFRPFSRMWPFDTTGGACRGPTGPWGATGGQVVMWAWVGPFCQYHGVRPGCVWFLRAICEHMAPWVAGDVVGLGGVCVVVRQDPGVPRAVRGCCAHGRGRLVSLMGCARGGNGPCRTPVGSWPRGWPVMSWVSEGCMSWSDRTLGYHGRPGGAPSKAQCNQQ